jgi:hypothetical protein
VAAAPPLRPRAGSPGCHPARQLARLGQGPINTDVAQRRLTRPKVGHVVAVALGVAGIGYLMFSSQVEATREFNYGVKAYEDERFEAAVAYFRRATELSPDPTVAYNLALASWAAAKDAADLLEGGNGWSRRSPLICRRTHRRPISPSPPALNGRMLGEGLTDLGATLSMPRLGSHGGLRHPGGSPVLPESGTKPNNASIWHDDFVGRSGYWNSSAQFGWIRRAWAGPGVEPGLYGQAYRILGTVGFGVAGALQWATGH